jgi:DNA-binding SARP family transcriptional activator
VEPERTRTAHLREGVPPVMICVLGSFRLLKWRRPIAVKGGGKLEALVSSLARAGSRGVARDELLCTLWPERESALAGQSLNTLLYSFCKLVADATDGEPPVRRAGRHYHLNVEAGVDTDVQQFEALAALGARREQSGDHLGATDTYARANRFYRGDLCLGSDITSLMDRERLRALHLTLLMRLADHHFSAGEYASCLTCAWKLLASDPYREDAHRLLMRCHVRRGERFQAIRQYRLCEEVLRAELNIGPEAATRTLFEQVLSQPESV